MSMTSMSCLASIWSAKAGSSGADSTSRPDCSCSTRRLRSSPGRACRASRRHRPRCGEGRSLSMTLASPNWRSASTSTTGRSERRASDTATLVASTDLPAPPLVENTVIMRAAGRRRPRRAFERRAGVTPGSDADTRVIGVEQLGLFDRGGEHVLEPGPQGELEQPGGQRVGHAGSPPTAGRDDSSGAARRDGRPRRPCEGPKITTVGPAQLLLDQLDVARPRSAPAAVRHRAPAGARSIGFEDDDRPFAHGVC